MMKTVTITSRAVWRQWLRSHRVDEPKGIWLVFYRKASGRPSLDYEAAVEEALCYGWIDSIIKRIDDARYCRKFTPRKDSSRWSELNKKRVKRLVRQRKMTPHGLAKVEAAKRLGNWQSDPRGTFNTRVPLELADALKQHTKADQYFHTLAPAYRKHFIGWVASAKRPETRERRAREAISLLASGKRLGLK